MVRFSWFHKNNLQGFDKEMPLSLQIILAENRAQSHRK